MSYEAPTFDIVTTEQRTTTVLAKLNKAQVSALLEGAVRARVNLPADQPGVTVDVSVISMDDGSVGAAIRIVVDHNTVPVEDDANSDEPILVPAVADHTADAAIHVHADDVPAPVPVAPPVAPAAPFVGLPGFPATKAA